MGEDGAFEFVDLHPGGWQVRAFEPGKRYRPGGGRMRTDRVPLPDVEVIAGRTVAYEHVARARNSARLFGRLSIDGAPPGVGRVIVRTSTAHASNASHETTLDPDGHFELSLEPDLRTSVTVLLQRDGTDLSIASTPVIVPGPNEWSVAFETARLAGTINLDGVPESPFGHGVTYEVETAGARIAARWTPGEEGRFGPVTVPAGRGTLVGPPRSFREPGGVLAELAIESGETCHVELPRR